MKGFLHPWTIHCDSQNAFENILIFKGNKGVVDPLTKEVVNDREEKTISACIGDFSETKNDTDGVKSTSNVTCKMVTGEDDLINWKFIKDGYIWIITEKRTSNTDGDLYYEYTCGRTTTTTEKLQNDLLSVNYD